MEIHFFPNFVSRDGKRRQEMRKRGVKNLQDKNFKVRRLSKKDLELLRKEDWSEVNRSILAYIDWRDNSKSPTASSPLR